jgi:hypothetical protein
MSYLSVICVRTKKGASVLESLVITLLRATTSFAAIAKRLGRHRVRSENDYRSITIMY